MLNFPTQCALLITVTLGALFLYDSRNVKAAPDATTIKSADNVTSANKKSDFTVKAGDFEMTYSLGREVKEDIIAVSVKPKSERKRRNPVSDFHSHMIAFTPKAAAKYVKKYPGTRICPQKFYNRHVNHVFLYPATDSVAKKLSQWELSNAKDVNNWQTVKFSGSCVKKRTKIMQNGEDISDTKIIVISQGRKSDCSSIYVRSFDVRPANIFGENSNI